MEQCKSPRKATRFYVAGVVLLFLAAVVCLFLDGIKEREPKMEVVPDNCYEETLVVAVDSDYQPYSFYAEDGQPAGYDVELIYLLANAMQRNVEIRMMQWTQAQEAVKSGEADVLMGLDYNVEALQEYELSMPLDNDPFVAFGKQGLSGIDGFYDKRIATLDGSGSFAAFLTPYQLEGNTRTYSSYSEAFRSVEDGENDYAIAMYSVGRRAIANLGESEMRAVGPTLAGNYLCIGTVKGNIGLMQELNRAVIRLKREGAMDRLGEKWLGRYVEVITARDFIKQNLTMLVLLTAVAMLSIALIYGAVSRRLAKSTAMQHEMTKRVLEYQQLLTEATKGLYENIYELDITNNRACGESTRQYFERLGIPGDTPLDKALRAIAEKQIKSEYIKGYLDIFSPENVLRAYQNGTDSLSYEFMICNETGGYYWMRITARIFYWKENATVRMITYRTNIDNEKKKERNLEEKVREDALTGLYNKVTTSELIRDTLAQEPKQMHAFLMLDIDNFKDVNDRFGHAFGDLAIVEFARVLKESIGEAIVGRVGGDEFAVFLPFTDRDELERKVVQIVRSLCREISQDDKCCRTSTSVGIALYPSDGTEFGALYRRADSALYQTKKRGKNGYTFFDGRGAGSGRTECAEGGTD